MKPYIKSHKANDDITIVNTYVNRFYDVDNKYTECLTIIYRDNKTGLKHKEEIINPPYEFFTVLPNFRTSYNRTFIEREQCESRTVPHTSLDKAVCDALGMSDFYKDCIRSGDRAKVKSIHKHPDVFMSDNNIEDHYRFWFAKIYTNNDFSISKSYFDIEVDGIDLEGDFPEPGQCPVNAITLILADKMKSYTFLLRNPRNPQIAEFEAYLANGGVSEIKQFILNHVSERNHRNGEPFYFGLENLELNFLFYDEEKEIDLIADFFKAVNSFKPDFLLAWNMAFDIPYLIERCKILGYDPRTIICHKDFKYPKCSYFIDERNKNEFAERCDFFAVSSYTVYLDQMIQFASRRKGQTMFKSFQLDYIANIMGNIRKLDYKDITDKIELLPYKNYKTFVVYNIIDTICQHVIEEYTQDLNYVFSKAVLNNTRYSKIHRQTVYLTNRGQSEMWDYGYVKGNNVNFDNIKIPYPGAFVADPLKVNDYSRLLINGNPTQIFANCLDFDYKSLYPSIMRQFLCFAFAQIGFIVIADAIHNKQNRSHYEFYTPGGQFLEDLQSHNWLDFGSRYFGLPEFGDLVSYIENVFTTQVRPSNPLPVRKEFDSNGNYNPFTQYPECYFPITGGLNSHGYYRPFAIDGTMPDTLKTKMKEWTDYVATTPNQSF